MQTMPLPICPVRLVNDCVLQHVASKYKSLIRPFSCPAESGLRKCAVSCIISLAWLVPPLWPENCFGEDIPVQLRQLFTQHDSSFTTGQAAFRDPRGKLIRQFSVCRDSDSVLVDEVWPERWQKVKVLASDYEFHVTRTEKDDPFQLSFMRSSIARTVIDRLSVEADVHQLLDADHSVLFLTLKELADTKGFQVDEVRKLSTEGNAEKIYVRFSVVGETAFLPRGSLTFDLGEPPVLEAFDILLISSNIPGAPMTAEKRLWVREERKFSPSERGGRSLVRAITYQGRHNEEDEVEVEYTTEVDSVTTDQPDASFFRPSHYGISDEVLSSFPRRGGHARNRSLLTNLFLLLGLVAALAARYVYRRRLGALSR